MAGGGADLYYLGCSLWWHGHGSFVPQAGPY